VAQRGTGVSHTSEQSLGRVGQGAPTAVLHGLLPSASEMGS